MGAFSRLNRVLQSNVNALLDRAEDPDKIIQSTLDEMRDGLKDAKRDMITSLGNAKRLAEEAQAAAEEAQKWEDRAALAVRAGDDGLARDALRQKLIAEQDAMAKGSQADAAKRAVADLEQAMERLEARRADLEARKSSLASQVRAARVGGGAGAGTAGTELDGLTSRIDAMEAEIEVAQTLDDPRRQDLEARFAQLEEQQRDAGVEDELAELKRRVDSNE